MWSDEQLNDAVQVLWNSSEKGDIQKVTDKDKPETEQYLVVGDVTYTDPLYIKALDKLVADKKFEAGKSTEKDREVFKRASAHSHSGGCCGEKH